MIAVTSETDILGWIFSAIPNKDVRRCYGSSSKEEVRYRITVPVEFEQDFPFKKGRVSYSF